MKKSILVALLALGVLAGPGYADETPTPEAAAPAAGVSSLWNFRRPPGQKDPSTDQWARAALIDADRDLQQGQHIRARHRVANVRGHLQSHPDPRYRWIAQRLYQVEADILRGSYHVARQELIAVIRSLGEGGGGGGGQYWQAIQELQGALSLLDSNQAAWARQNLGRAYQIMIRSPDQTLRLESNQVRYADQLAARNQSFEAAGIVRGILARLQHGGGGGGGQDPDFANRREWRRDIRDLIDTIQGGNLNMAHRDLQTLQRDIRQDGHDWQQNRQWVQRLGFVGQNLRRGNEPWCIQQLREISRDLNY